MHALTGIFTRLCIRYPLLGGIFGLLMAVMFGFLGFSSWQEMQTMPQEPLRLSLAEAIAAVEAAGEDRWVTINAVAWDCDNIVPTDSSRARALFSDEAGTVLGVASLLRPSGWDLACADLGPTEVTGVLRPLSQGEYDRLDDTGFNLALRQCERADRTMHLLRTRQLQGRGDHLGCHGGARASIVSHVFAAAARALASVSAQD